VPLAAGVIVGVVRRRDLHGARAEVHVDQDAVQDDRDLAAVERVDDVLAVQVLVLGVLRVDGHGRVAEHGFQTGGGHDDLFVQAVDLVGEGGDDAELVLPALRVVLRPVVADDRHLVEGGDVHVLHLGRRETAGEVGGEWRVHVKQLRRISQNG
jgi:hypothetical protein